MIKDTGQDTDGNIATFSEIFSHVWLSKNIYIEFLMIKDTGQEGTDARVATFPDIFFPNSELKRCFLVSHSTRGNKMRASNIRRIS